MNSLSGFLEKYRNFVAPPLAAARAVRTAILEVTGIDVGEKSVTVRKGRAVVALGGLEKNEILMRRGEILAKVREKMGDAVRELS